MLGRLFSQSGQNAARGRPFLRFYVDTQTPQQVGKKLVEETKKSMSWVYAGGAFLVGVAVRRYA
jgi:hypothetical protein